MQRVLPGGHGLTGQTVDQVQAQVVDFGLPDVRHRLDHLLGGVDAVEAPKLLGVRGLHPQGDAVDPAAAQTGHGAPVHAVWDALHGNLRLAADGKQPLNQGENLPQAFFPIVGGSAAAKVDGIRHPALHPGAKGAQVGQQRPLVAVHLLLLTGQGVEVTVVAFALAEGNVDIDAKGVGHKDHSNPA